MIAIVFNNIAEIHKCKNEYYYAMHYINRALRYPGINKETYFIAFETYVEIKSMVNETEDTLDKLLEMLSQMENTHTWVDYFVLGINIILEYGKSDKQLLIKLKEAVANMIKNTNKENTEYKNELINSYGQISLYLDDIYV